MSASTQRVGDLTVERCVTDGRVWWVWKDAAGKQLHAGMADREYILGHWYVLLSEGWREE
ncbi:MAG: hypothetical protein FD189_1048 [Elusimicrobia bacterium]|nr:MAG: hypothetical protein FD189_1048 [Elusimicrobiota bacterium]